MAQFPSKQALATALAKSVLAGLAAKPDVFPQPAVELAEFAAQIQAYEKAMIELTQIDARKQMAAKNKQKAFEKMTGSLKRQLRYAENAAGVDDAKLTSLGWSARRPKSGSALPGQVRYLRAVEQGSDFVILRWMKPSEGSKPAAYQILRRDGKSSQWLNAGVAMTTKIKLTGQPKLIDLEYQVTALNKSGQGAASNIIAVVL